MTVSFDVNPTDRQDIRKIVDRAMIIWPHAERLSLHMDVTACHANGNPLRLRDLLAADEFNFIHDVGGINRHLDRETGRLMNHFSPRFSAKRKAA